MMSSLQFIKQDRKAIKQNQLSAVGTDLIRGLIELITNSDDAYGENTSGEIIIKFKNKEIYIYDKAGGINNIDDALTQGATTAKFYNSGISRGRLGRGLKDVPVLAKESSFHIYTIHNSKFQHVFFEDSTSWRKVEENNKIISDESRRILLELSDGGTLINFELNENVVKPKFDKLVFSLSNDFELRDLVKRRKIKLIDGNKSVYLANSFVKDNYELVHKSIFKVYGFENYEDVQLNLFKLSEPAIEQVSKRSSEAGILIKGGFNTFENTLFDYGKRAGSLYLHGEIYAPAIDQLYFEYDQIFHNSNSKFKDSKNPLWIISPSRIGLDRQHPFVKNLIKQIEPEIEKFLEAFEQKIEEIPLLDQLSQKRVEKDIAKWIRSLFSEESLGVDGVEDELIVIPRSVVLEKNEIKTITVLGSLETFQAGDQLSTKILDGDSVELINNGKSIFTLSSEQYSHNKVIANLQIRALTTGKNKIEITSKESSAFLNVTVVDKLEKVTVDDLVFDSQSYSVSPFIQKKVTVLAPLNYLENVDGGNNIVRFEISNDTFSFVNEQYVHLIHDKDSGFLKGELKIETKHSNGTATIKAFHINSTTQAKLKIKKDDISTIIPKISWNEQETHSMSRANAERQEKYLLLTVHLKHPAVRDIIKNRTEINTQKAQVLLSEIVGEACISYFLGTQENLNDFDDFLFEFNRLKREKLPGLQKIFLKGGLKVLEV